MNDTFIQLTPEPRIVSIISDSAVVVGRDEETPEEFRQRRNRSLENPATGSTGAVFAKVAQLTGVIDLNIGENDTKLIIQRRGSRPIQYGWSLRGSNFRNCRGDG